MMTASVLSAGDGYQYYTQSIATGDFERTPGTPVTDYYTADGNPPGVWMGGGIQHLGVGGVVTEAQMKALFGEGLHPNADSITSTMLSAGATEAEISAAIKLGRALYKFDTKDTVLAERVATSFTEFERLNDRKPDRDERRQLRVQEGAQVFRDVHGRAAIDNEELAKYVTNAMKPAQHAVSGFDLTFSPPKSVSVLWALADRPTAVVIAQAHELAISDTLAYLESVALATRAGTNGVRQTDVVGGAIATRFRHHESRTGDPQLHDHMVVANKVLGTDGTWRTIDSKLLLRSVVDLSEHYNKRLFDHLDAAGLAGRARTVTSGKPPVMEIAGEAFGTLIDAFSTRGTSIKRATDELVKEYVREHGRTPGNTARIKLSATAWQQTRPAKDKPRSIEQLRADVLMQAKTTGVRNLDKLVDHARTASRVHKLAAAAQPALDLHEAAATIMATVEASRSTWAEHHVTAEITRWLSHNRYRDLTITDGAGPHLVDQAEALRFLRHNTLQLDSVRVTPDHVHGTFEPLTRTDGQSFYVSKGHTLYTSVRVLQAEQRLLTAAQTTAHGRAAVTADQFARALQNNPNKDAAQVRLAREFVTNRTQLLVGIGPAGAGKTRSMRLAAAAVHEAGGRMFGLALSKQAVKVFRDEVHVPAFTIDGFLTAHAAAAREGRPVSQRYQVRAGDVVVVDEAAMASTNHLDQVTHIITTAGGYVRPLGDHAQISAIGAGGAVRLIATEVGAVELQNIYRFSDKHEAAASIILRDSPATVDPFAWYKDNGRIIAGTRDRIAEVLFADYQKDIAAGRAAVMGAPTRDYVDELNARAQAHAIATGTITGRRSAPLQDGHHAHTGDQIMTRRNNRKLTMNQGRDSVDNGDLYTVTKVHRDGALTVRHNRHGGKVTLPAGYVKAHTHLGYAFTAHQEQGETVGGMNSAGHFVDGVSRGIVTARTPRAQAYVLATRGVTANVLYVETEPGQHPDDVLAAIAKNLDTDLSAHETIATEADRILDLQRLVDEHTDVVALANETRFETIAERSLSPVDAAALTGADGWGAASALLARAEQHGLDPAQVLAEAWAQRELGDADDHGAVIAWRIEEHLTVLENAGSIPSVPEPGTDTGRYEWAVDRTTQNSPDLPDDWRAHLAERASYIDQRMTLRGAELALELPDWTTQLGAVPGDPQRQKEWMRLAAEVELFRGRYNVTSPTTAIPNQNREQPLGKNLADRITALHKSTSIRSAAGTHAPIDPQAQLEKTTQVSRDLEAKRPQSDAERALAALSPDRRTQLDQRLARLKKAAERTAEAANQKRAEEPTARTDLPPQPQPRGPKL